MRAFQADGPIQRSSLWWLHEGNRAIRVGDWKLVAAKDQPWELFDLSNDATEQRNRINVEKQRAKQLESEWNRQLEEFRHRYREARRELQKQRRD
jgi:arylsulfatase A-like enzyme